MTLPSGTTTTPRTGDVWRCKPVDRLGNASDWEKNYTVMYVEGDVVIFEELLGQMTHDRSLTSHMVESDNWTLVSRPAESGVEGF